MNKNYIVSWFDNEGNEWLSDNMNRYEATFQYLLYCILHLYS